MGHESLSITFHLGLFMLHYKFHRWFLVPSNKSIDQIFRIIVQVLTWWWCGGQPVLKMICACCDSGAAVFTNTWRRFVGKNNWGWRCVDTSSCLQGWNEDLTPTAVPQRHQLGLEPGKMSFPSSRSTLCPSQPWAFYLPLLLTSLGSPPVFSIFISCCPFTLILLSPKHPSSVSAALISFLNPFFPTCSVSSSHKSFPVTQRRFFCQLFFSPWTPVSVAQ